MCVMGEEIISDTFPHFITRSTITLLKLITSVLLGIYKINSWFFQLFFFFFFGGPGFELWGS
jgi:hypothetical protein